MGSGDGAGAGSSGDTSATAANEDIGANPEAATEATAANENANVDTSRSTENTAANEDANVPAPEEKGIFSAENIFGAVLSVAGLVTGLTGIKAASTAFTGYQVGKAVSQRASRSRSAPDTRAGKTPSQNLDDNDVDIPGEKSTLGQ